MLNSLTTNAPHYIETSQLFCFPSRLTGFYMMGNVGRQRVNKILYMALKSTLVIRSLNTNKSLNVAL